MRQKEWPSCRSHHVPLGKHAMHVIHITMAVASLCGQSCAVPLRCNAVINACATGSCWETALQLLRDEDNAGGIFSSVFLHPFKVYSCIAFVTNSQIGMLAEQNLFQDFCYCHIL